MLVCEKKNYCYSDCKDFFHSLAEIPSESNDKFSLFREVLGGVTLIERWARARARAKGGLYVSACWDKIAGIIWTWWSGLNPL